MAKVEAEKGSFTRADIYKLRGRIQLKAWRERVYVARWPRRRGPVKSPSQQASIQAFVDRAVALKAPDGNTLMQVQAAVKGTGWYYRDALEAASYNKLISHLGEHRVTTPTAKALRTTTLSLTSGVETAVPFGSVQWNNNDFWEGITHPTRLTFHSPGLYLLIGHIELHQGKTTERVIIIKKNGTDYLALDNRNYTGTSWGFLGIQAIDYFHAGDYIELVAQTFTTTDPIAAANLIALGITPEAIV